MSPARKPTLRGARLLRALLRLVRIYWASADARWGVVLFFGAIALEVATVWANLRIAASQRDVVEILEHHQPERIWLAGVLYVGYLLLFLIASTYRVYVRQVLEIRWRNDLTAVFVDRWMSPRAFGQTQLHPELDNPDQRIAEDVRDFVASALGLSLSFLGAVVTLVSFGGLLWALSSDWRIPIDGTEVQVPGLLLWVALAAAALSMGVTHLMGRRLVPINFDRFRLEADFRYGLVRFRDHTKEIALSRGELVERRGAAERFRHVFDIFLQLVRAERNLALVTGGVGQVTGLLPLLLAMPAYFKGLLTLGAIVQARTAYDQVSGALLWFVNAYREIARWRANIERIAAFGEVMYSTAKAFDHAGITLTRGEGDALRITGLRVEAPPGHLLLEAPSAVVRPGDRIAIVGPLGKGKSTFFRAIAGIWPFGTGRIERPDRRRMHFVSQRPYLPLGSLRAVISYPAAGGAFSDERIRDALEAFGIGSLAARLDDEETWDHALSGHEKQLLAMARVLLHRPDWILLDDATSGLDEVTERRIYEVLLQRLPHAAVVALGARMSVLDLLPRRWTLTPRADGSVVLEAA